jgi:uncharacterized protein (DUF736 family)
MSTENSNKQSEWQKRECGALWKKESPTQKYFSGHVKVTDNGEEKMVRLIVFSNRNKEKDSQPDFRIYTADDTQKQPEETVAAAVVQDVGEVL